MYNNFCYACFFHFYPKLRRHRFQLSSAPPSVCGGRGRLLGSQTLLSNYSRRHRRRRRIAPNTAQPSCRRSLLFNLNYAAFIRAPTRGCQHWSPELVGLQSIKQSSASPEPQQKDDDDDKEELLFFFFSQVILIQPYLIFIIKLVQLLMEGTFLGLPKLLPRSRLDGLKSVTLLEN